GTPLRFGEGPGEGLTAFFPEGYGSRRWRRHPRDASADARPVSSSWQRDPASPRCAPSGSSRALRLVLAYGTAGSSPRRGTDRRGPGRPGGRRCRAPRRIGLNLQWIELGKENTMASGKPNILIIWGDDIGWFNISANNNGVMGYRTPNIDRVAREGALFTDWYGQQSCTAGRAAFITRQTPIPTGLTQVGL